MAVAGIGAVQSELAHHSREARLARVLALIVDSIAVSVLSLVVTNVYGVEQITSGSPASFHYTSTTSVAWPWLTLLGILYFTVPEALFGASPGKYWARLRVVRVDEKPLDLRAVVIRNVLKPIDFLPMLYLLGGVSVLITAKSQRLGDLAAGTTVVYRHHALEPGATRNMSSQARRVAGIVLAVAMLFTIAFNYFGRPPLIVQGLFNTGRFFPDGTAYKLGNPEWSLGTVTYPITVFGTSRTCTGTITLNWYVLGWGEGGASWGCRP
jgi:uncharacterized RDD family membrane protein YckC